MIELILILLSIYLIFGMITYILIRKASKWDDDPLSRAQTIFVSLCPIVNVFMFGYALWIYTIKSLE